jgi:predicted transcriptional regulator
MAAMEKKKGPPRHYPTTICTRVSEKTFSRLAKLALDEDRPISWIVRRILVQHLDAQGKKGQK